MNRSSFARKYNTAYQWLLRNNPSLLDEIFPKVKVENSALKKEEIIKLALTNSTKPSQKTKIGMSLASYINPSSGCYDKKFSIKIKKLRPEWFRTRSQKAFDKMMKVIPQELVKYDTSQKWRGASKKHKFIDKKYGPFYGIPSQLMATSWRKGLSGHPANRGQKSVINLTTNKIYNSVRDAAFSVKKRDSAMVMALKRGTKCGGYHWAYCDENGKIIK